MRRCCRFVLSAGGKGRVGLKNARGLKRKPAGILKTKKISTMKTLNNYIGISTGIAIAFLVAALIVVFSSCSAPHWYKAANDGCQSSQGMGGYGNRK
jgi:hypothetical protein